MALPFLQSYVVQAESKNHPAHQELLTLCTLEVIRLISPSFHNTRSTTHVDWTWIVPQHDAGKTGPTNWQLLFVRAWWQSNQYSSKAHYESIVVVVVVVSLQGKCEIIEIRRLAPSSGESGGPNRAMIPATIDFGLHG